MREKLGKVRNAMSNFGLGDVLTIFAELMTLRNKISRFLVCIDNNKIVFIGDIHGELIVDNPDVLRFVMRFAKPCPK